MRNLVPFAVVGSNSIIEVFDIIITIIIIIIIMSITDNHDHYPHDQDANGRKARGRSYPWGTVNIEERQHCDFQATKLFTFAGKHILEIFRL